METYILFANTTKQVEESSGGIFEALGIDAKVMIFQFVAFGILVFILAKWIYPPILAMLDRRDKTINDSLKAAKDANEKSEKAREDISKQLKAARDEANDIVAAAREQSTQMIVDSEKDAERRAESLVSAARAQLDRDVEAARKALRDETVSLVSLAAEKIISQKVDSAKDEKIIEQAIFDASGSKKGSK